LIQIRWIDWRGASSPPLRLRLASSTRNTSAGFRAFRKPQRLISAHQCQRKLIASKKILQTAARVALLNLSSMSCLPRSKLWLALSVRLRANRRWN
jgi:hypothetical protein